MLAFFYTLIIYPLVQIIEFSFMVFNDIFKNPGISVIGVSLSVSLICLPLYIVAERWQEIQRQTEKSLENGINRIKSTFTGDEQYMILSTFYKQHHYHPIMALRSSFGLLIQIPFFIAAYTFLSNLPALHGKPFFFIRDMGAQDALFHIGSFPINILPIAMTLINIIAGAIYTKGFKAREKIQIYAMAIVFLILLYSSPSGLVLYWTMNNIFSLIKNIFYKLKNPLKVLYLVLFTTLIALDWYLLFKHSGPFHKRIILVIGLSVLFFIPLIIRGINTLLNGVFSPLETNKKQRFILFLLSVLSLFLLSGFVIPSYIINSSVQEFSGIDGYGTPLYFLGISSIQSFGLYVLWPVCIYFLFHDRIQTLFAVLFSLMLFCGLINAFLFSGEYGTLSRLITFSTNLTGTSVKAILFNSAILVLFILLYFILFKIKRQSIITGVTSIILIAEFSIVIIHTFQIQKGYTDYKKTVSDSVSEAKNIQPVYHLSKTGKNVVVFMLDRAENAYVEPIFSAFPELRDTYTGFTLYSNTVSFNQGTLLGAPPLYGGWEYTPAEMNKRKEEKLVDKNNEALLIMPRVFTEQGDDFTAAVSDLSWANYSWIPDMSICNPYPKISAYNIERKYSSLWISQNPDKVKKNITSSSIKRNLLYFSIFKESPVFLRDSIYHDGSWWSSDRQKTDIQELIDFYSALSFLPQLTDFTCRSKNSFTCIVNETTHSEQRLEAPDYEPASNCTDKYRLSSFSNFECIDVNIAAFKRISEWISYLKTNDCYDNTRIILVSDHGIGTKMGKQITFGDTWNLPFNPDHEHPLLMVKDFNSKGPLLINHEFMSNADVPAIAFAELVEKPFNPFTKKIITRISPTEKKAAGIVLTANWRPGGNTPYAFKVPENDWYTVTKDITKPDNWQKGIQ